jgi:hypothetical protein
MENEELYLIHKEDYIRHIDEKLELYAMLRQLISVINKMPNCDAARDAKKTAAVYTGKCDILFESWDIPKCYLVGGDTDDLRELMENELILPEDAGYVPLGEYNADVFEYYDDDYGETGISALLAVSKELNAVSAHLLNIVADLADEA